MIFWPPRLKTDTFLSTLSLRRATKSPANSGPSIRYFYPRSPCGERQHCPAHPTSAPVISIHALLAESDRAKYPCSGPPGRFLSTLSLRRATVTPRHSTVRACYFYPRSPCGERLGIPNQVGTWDVISIHALLAESDVLGAVTSPAVIKFLSTLSLRRATQAKTHRT